MKHHTGSIEVVTGSMFSGKTDELIRRLRRATIARQKVQVLNPLSITAIMSIRSLPTLEPSLTRFRYPPRRTY